MALSRLKGGALWSGPQSHMEDSKLLSSFIADLKMYRDFFARWWKYRKRMKRDDVWIQKYAVAKGLRVNPHAMFYTNLKIWIEESRDPYGRQQCPCAEPSGDEGLDKKLLCPCSFALADVEAKGVCHCVLFGRGDLTDAEFAHAEKELQREYRPGLNLVGNRLDTRGQPPDPRRGLPVPDATHQVKQALNAVSGDLVVVVDREASVDNLGKVAASRGFGFDRREVSPGVYEVTLKRS